MLRAERMAKVLHSTPGKQRFRKTGADDLNAGGLGSTQARDNQGGALTSLLESFQDSHPRSLWSLPRSPPERKPDPFAFSFRTPISAPDVKLPGQGFLVQGAP